MQAWAGEAVRFGSQTSDEVHGADEVSDLNPRSDRQVGRAHIALVSDDDDGAASHPPRELHSAGQRGADRLARPSHEIDPTVTGAVLFGSLKAPFDPRRLHGPGGSEVTGNV